MRLYNPTQESVFAKCAGITYYFEAGKSIETSKETGEWILDKYLVYGIVDISVKDTGENFDYKNYVAKKAMEGIKNHLVHLHDIIDNFIELDSEIKAKNYNGTVLNHRRVKDVMVKINLYTKLLEQLEQKFGFSIATDDYKKKEVDLLDSIDVAVAQFEADSEAKQRTEKINVDVDKFLKEAVGDVNNISAMA